MAHKSDNPNKRFRSSSDHSGHLTGDLSQLNDLLDTISADETSFQQAVTLILQKGNFKQALSEMLAPEISTLREEVSKLHSRIDEMEQYSRRNCIKITGIAEKREEDTDAVVLNVLNNLVLTKQDQKITLRDLKFFKRSITSDIDNFHTITQRTWNS